MSKPSSCKSASLKPEDTYDTESSVQVTRLRSRSRGGTDLDTKSQSSPSNDNPMEQPQFGAPSDNSYYVSSSQFTSKDVEEFKRISSQRGSMPKSQCSSSSRISCPDPPHMNLSPAAYVDKLFSTSPASEQSSEILDRKDNGGASASRESSELFYTEDIHSSEDKRKPGGSEVFSADYDAPLYDENTGVQVTDSETSESKTLGRTDLEESWEEFYKSPVKKIADDENYRKFQRLESINRELKEDAILREFDKAEANKKEMDEPAEMVESTQTIVAENSEKETDEHEKGDVKFELCGDEDSLLEKLDSEATCSKDNDVSEDIEISSGTDNLLDLSQKILNELGIEDKDTSEDTHDPVHIEEKVRLDSGEDDSEITSTTQKKKRKVKKNSVDKYKPMLSLSPPNRQGSEPELSNAVADKVDQIRTSENPDYLRKHRLSMPATGGNKEKLSPSRQPAANVLENEASSSNMSRSPYSIEDYLYKGISEEEYNRAENRAGNSDSPSKSAVNTEKEDERKSRASSGNEIDEEEGKAIYGYVQLLILC